VEYEAPGTATEEALAKIWMEVLKVDRAGIRDNFFRLGGHSLLATQVVARISRSMSASLPIREVFLHPTIADLADYMDQNLEQLHLRHAISGTIPRLERHFS
jgi:acyl carrier protein